ncbi:S-layer homology domain-containing protein [Anaerobacterium chartisolvens]|nr:S-layer homology domain-containing protein [Anaerobacterium chartisolvens]
MSTLIVLAILAYALPVFAESTEARPFSDVPASSPAYDAINSLRELNIIKGTGENKFGYGKPLKRSEFVMYLVSLMQWELLTPEKASFTDSTSKSSAYYAYIETALSKGVIKRDAEKFRPSDYITREEAAVMLVRCMGYNTLAAQPSLQYKPYEDVSDSKGYIVIARDLGIVSASEKSLFSPKQPVKKEDAALWLMRMHSKLNIRIDELHAFYALGAYSQKELINRLDSVSFGWSRLEYNKQAYRVELSMSNKNNADFYLPTGFKDPIDTAVKAGVSTQLNVYASQDTRVWEEEKQKYVGIVDFVTSKPQRRKAIIDSIIKKLSSTYSQNGQSISFDGVVIDFEGLKGEASSEGLNTFLAELKKELSQTEKKLYVAVHPRVENQVCYDGYDYKTIGSLADKVILMAHDYNAMVLTQSDMDRNVTFTPVTPIDQVYYALKTITDKASGVEDTSKIWLQISFGTAQWQSKDNKVINKRVYTTSSDKIRDRVLNSDGMKDLRVNYSASSENPYITYLNPKDNVYNRIWYEDSRSVHAKIKLANMFGIYGISLWRLGNIPDYDGDIEKGAYLDVWQQILNLSGGKDDTED